MRFSGAGSVMRIRLRAAFLLKGLLFSLAVLIFSASRPYPTAQERSGSRPPHPPRKWEVRIDLKTVGDYRFEEGGPNFNGHYSFAVRWTGWLERDDHDYLLYRLDSRLCDWEAQETASLTTEERVLSTKDFDQRPAFALRYVIRDGDDLSLDFIVDPLSVPQARPEDAFPLLLPSSAQNGQRQSQVDYNSGVTVGSNRVELPESMIYAGPVTRTYTWSWKHQEWVPLERRTVFTFQSHNVEVQLCITPQLRRP
jgi:hypothetical protein